MKYSEIIEYIYAIPMFQNIGSAAYNPSLDKTISLCEYLGNPQSDFKSIHIAGTNGKGSSSSLLASVFIEAGYKVGLYTSPHLIDYRERIVINNEMIPQNDVVEFMDIAFEKIDQLKPSFFEFTTALAFWAFAKNGVDIAIIETGLGGRIDSTNIINPMVSLITNISEDHKNILGDTLEQIAAEKAGIIKPFTDVVIGEKAQFSENVFRDYAKKNNSKIFFAQDKYTVRDAYYKDGFHCLNIENNGVCESYRLSLLGSYQQKNILGVLNVLDIISEREDFIISKENILNGLQRCKITGRWQILSKCPYTVCDVGHNKDGIKEIVKMLKTTTYNRLFMVIGFMADKDVDEILSLLPKQAHYIFTKAPSERAMNEQELEKKAAKYGLLGSCESDVADAYKKAISMADKSDMVFIGGSSYVVAQLLNDMNV